MVHHGNAIISSGSPLHEFAQWHKPADRTELGKMQEHTNQEECKRACVSALRRSHSAPKWKELLQLHGQNKPEQLICRSELENLLHHFISFLKRRICSV